MKPGSIGVKDLYKLREAALGAQRARLRAELAQQNLKELLLYLERRYNLLGTAASLDIYTGKITMDDNARNGHSQGQARGEEVNDGPDPDAD